MKPCQKLGLDRAVDQSWSHRRGQLAIRGPASPGFGQVSTLERACPLRQGRAVNIASPDAVCAFWRQGEVNDAAQELVRHLDEDAGAIARVHLGTERAAVGRDWQSAPSAVSTMSGFEPPLRRQRTQRRRRRAPGAVIEAACGRQALNGSGRLWSLGSSRLPRFRRVLPATYDTRR